MVLQSVGTYKFALPHWYSFGGGGGDGGDGWSGTGDGTGDTGGGGDGWWSDDPCNGRIGGRIEPDNDCDPGWIPIEDNSAAYTDPQTLSFFSDPAIDLQKLFNCFNQVPDNGATYKIKICTDLPNNNNPNHLVTTGGSVGHAFITLTKTNGNVSVTQSFGFYPTDGVKSIGMSPQPSKINDNGSHEYNASMEMPISIGQFVWVKSAAILNATNQYDLNGYNCTDYALQIFNGVRQNDPIVVPDWHGAGTGFNYGTTPNGLYFKLQERSTNPQVFIGTSNAPAGSGLCQ
jgi:hypothetical protein